MNKFSSHLKSIDWWSLNIFAAQLEYPYGQFDGHP